MARPRCMCIRQEISCSPINTSPLKQSRPSQQSKRPCADTQGNQSVCPSASQGERLMSRARPNDASSEIMASHQPASLLTEPCPGSSTVCNFPPSDKGLACPLGAHRYKLTCLCFAFCMGWLSLQQTLAQRRNVCSKAQVSSQSDISRPRSRADPSPARCSEVHMPCQLRNWWIKRSGVHYPAPNAGARCRGARMHTSLYVLMFVILPVF